MGNPPNLELRFAGASDPQLESVSFEPPGDRQKRLAVRGRLYVGASDYVPGTFQWTTAVRALCILILKSISTSKSKSKLRPTLSGEARTLAASLDYAIAKQTQWLADMFGTEADGTILARRMVKRINSERKRPGPVVISWNDNFVEPSNIKIVLNEKELNGTAELEQLQRRLEKREVSIIHTTAGVKSGDGCQPSIGSVRATLASADESGLVMLPFSVSDYLLDLLDVNGPMKIDSLARETQARLPFAVGSKIVTDAASVLIRRGVLSSDQNGHVAPTDSFDASRNSLFTSAINIAACQQVRCEILGKSVCEIRFRSLADLDPFLSQFYRCCLSAVREPSESWWQLSHSLWPLLRPVEECQRASVYPQYANTYYLCAGTTKIDKWVSNFYSRLAVKSFLGVPLLFDCDFWVIGDVLVSHIIPAEVQREIDRFVKNHDDIANFDNLELHNSAYATTADCIVRIAFAPGLTASLRRSLRLSVASKAA